VRDALVRRRLIGMGGGLSLNNHVVLVKELSLVVLQGVHSFVLLRILCVQLIQAVWNISVRSTR
jgi:hypothetical protein